MFNKEQRGTLKYTFAHWCAFQMEALNMGVWKWKYLLHDIDKPILMTIAKVFGKNYKWVQKIHRSIRSHHIETKRKFDPVATIIDWQCSQYTKADNQLNAIQYMKLHRNDMSEDQIDALISAYTKMYEQRSLL